MSCIFAPNNLRPQRLEDDAMTSQQNQAVEMGSAMQKVQQTAEISGAVATPDTKQDQVAVELLSTADVEEKMAEPTT